MVFSSAQTNAAPSEGLGWDGKRPYDPSFWRSAHRDFGAGRRAPCTVQMQMRAAQMLARGRRRREPRWGPGRRPDLGLLWQEQGGTGDPTSDG